MYEKEIEGIENNRLFTYQTIKNNGQVDGTTLTGQCLWLSLCTALCHILDPLIAEGFTVGELKALASSNGACINGDNEIFDFDKHSQAVVNLCKIFDFCVGICCVLQYSENGPKYVNPNNPMFTSYYGNMDVDEDRIVFIASYRTHFELIIQIGGKYTHPEFVMYRDEFVHDEVQASTIVPVSVQEYVSVPSQTQTHNHVYVHEYERENDHVYIPVHDQAFIPEPTYTSVPVKLSIDEQIKNTMETLDCNEQKIAKLIVERPDLFREPFEHSLPHKKSFDVAMYILQLANKI